MWETAERLQPVFAAIDRLVAHNLRRVQAAFAKSRIGPHHFSGSTGYGHGDLGRAALDEVCLAQRICRSLYAVMAKSVGEALNKTLSCAISASTEIVGR